MSQTKYMYLRSLHTVIDLSKLTKITFELSRTNTCCVLLSERLTLQVSALDTKIPLTKENASKMLYKLSQLFHRFLNSPFRYSFDVEKVLSKLLVRLSRN